MPAPTRRALLTGLLAACGPWPWPGPTAEDRARRWLLDQQADDGAFRSETYGLFRHGHSLTGLIVLALGEGSPGAVARALGFLASVRGPTGALGLLDVADYPMYATSLAIRGFAVHRPAGWREVVAPMVGWIRDQQLVGAAWGDHPSRGGFPMGAADRRTPPHAGHVDLSMTRRALQALSAVGVSADDPAMVEGCRFVHRCRGGGGGFRYSPGQPMLNKGAGPDASYGTATADGVLALSAAAEIDADGLRWLRDHFRADENPGVGGGPMSAFARAMRFYWRASVAESFAAHPDAAPVGWRVALSEAVIPEQRDDGAFRNASVEQKEDDPLVATALALSALSA